MSANLNFGSRARSAKATTFMITAFVLTIFMAGFVYLHLTTPSTYTGNKSHPDSPSEDSDSNNSTSDPESGASSLDVESFFKYIRKPSVEPTAAAYKPWNGFEYKLPQLRNGTELAFKEPLGERLCIIDMDNRSWNESGYIWSDRFSWADEPQGQSLGLLSHWVYAKIHGYKYYFIEIEEPEDRRSSWMKPPIISKLLPKHDACVYLDSDAIFHHPDLPMEWLMNYWSIDPERDSLTLAIDPDLEHNKDKFGKLYDNTGFIISQNQPTTYEIMQDWWDCPGENSKHPECADFSFSDPGKPTDQGGFGTYVRYDWQSNIKELKCAEANGYLGSGTKCAGTFITHLWTGKHTWLNVAAGELMPGDWLEILHKAFLEEKDTFYMKQADVLGDWTDGPFVP